MFPIRPWKTSERVVVRLVSKQYLSSRPVLRTQTTNRTRQSKNSPKYVAISKPCKPSDSSNPPKPASPSTTLTPVITQTEAETKEQTGTRSLGLLGFSSVSLRKGLFAALGIDERYGDAVNWETVPKVKALKARNSSGETFDEEWDRVKRWFSKKPEVGPANFEFKRLQGCIAHLKPYINEEHLIDFTTHVYRSENTNASATLTESGVVLVQCDTKTIQDCNNDNQLAFIAAHEISHLVARHSEHRRHILNLRELEALRFQHELDADELGVMMMASAGYDERGAIEWMERSVRQKRRDDKRFPPPPIPLEQRTHPPIEARLARMRTLLPQATALRIECATLREQTAQKAREAKRRMQAARAVTPPARIEKSEAIVEKLLPKLETITLAAKPPMVHRTVRSPPAWLKLEEVKKQ